LVQEDVSVTIVITLNAERPTEKTQQYEKGIKIARLKEEGGYISGLMILKEPSNVSYVVKITQLVWTFTIETPLLSKEILLS